MVSTGQMMGYVMAILLPLIAVLIPFYILWKQSSKVERGMLGAIGYGIMGYFWQEIIYSFLGLLALTKMRDVLNTTGGNAVVVAFVEALAGSIFVAAGLYWGVYLTNTKQRSLYRSTTVGLGFGLGAAFLTYGFQLYYAIRINVGAFTGTDMAKASILSTSTASLYLDAVRNILVVLVYMGVAFLVGKNYLEKKRLAAWLTPIIVYVFIRFTDVILNTYAPALVAKIVYMIVLAFVAAVSVWMVRNWYQSEKQVKKQF